MKKFIAGLACGIIVAAPVAGIAATQSKSRPGPQAVCHAWKDRSVQECSLYFPDVKHMRVTMYELGEFSMQVDWFPGWGRKGHMEKRLVK